MASIFAILKCIALIAAATSTANAVDAATLAPVTVADVQPFSLVVNTTTRVATQTMIPVPGATFMTVHFAEFNLAAGDKVVVRDVQGVTKYEYTGLGRGDLGKRGGFFSSRVPGDQAIVEFQPASGVVIDMGDFGYKVDKITRSSTSASSSTVCGTDDTRPAKCYIGDASVPEAYTKAQAVARLFITATGETCTGWLVGSEGHLLTNAHCIKTDKQAATADFELAAESVSCSQECQVLTGCGAGKLAAETSELIAFDAKIDYALVKLKPSVDLSGYGHLSLRVSGPIQGEQVYVPQHPQGWAKRIAAVDDLQNVTRIGGVSVTTLCGAGRVTYNADTRPGSSGSPVLAASDNHVVALHSCGPGENESCKNSAVDIRTVIWDLRNKNVTLPDDAFTDPNGGIGEGPWIPGFGGEAPPVVTPAPSPALPASICRVFRPANCEIVSTGRCVVVNGACVPSPTYGATTPAPPTPTE